MAQQQADLPNTHGGVRGVINDNATDAETRLAKPDKARVGFVDLNDAATAITPISVSADTWTPLTNDTLGAFTNTDYLPEGVTDIFSSDQFDFSELSVGDMVNIRADITVTTANQNQIIKLRLKSALGTAFEFTTLYGEVFVKSAGEHEYQFFNGVYIGSADVLNNPAQFEVFSDDDMDVVVNGWFIQLLLRGEAS